jgi:molecular chaperone DnaK (HSP70)
VTYHLGVDLGTTFVAAALSVDSKAEMFTLGDRSVVTPAVVYLREDGQMVTGEAANRRASSSPERVGREFKRRLGDPTPVMLGGTPHSATDLLGVLLRDVLLKVTETEGVPPQAVVLTHPANRGGFRRGLFEEVPRLAGLVETVTITEPEAAAAHYAATRDLDTGETVAVYDLGGGTFDVTVLRKSPGGVEIVGTPEGIEVWAASTSTTRCSSTSTMSPVERSASSIPASTAASWPWPGCARTAYSQRSPSRSTARP